MLFFVEKKFDSTRFVIKSESMIFYRNLRSKLRLIDHTDILNYYIYNNYREPEVPLGLLAALDFDMQDKDMKMTI